MDSWEGFDETLSDKKSFCSKLYLEDITDEDYVHAQKVVEEVNYHNLYVQSHTLLLADEFQNFRNKCIEIYELDAANFLSAPGLAWQASLKNTGVELELLIDINMLLMVKKGIQGGICHVVHRYAKANNKYIKIYDKNIECNSAESSYLMYLDANNLYGWALALYHYLKERKLKSVTGLFVPYGIKKTMLCI